ncbi:MAG: TIGR00341 family protein [Candidatus Nanohaloarchaea archaeon]
MRQLQVTVPKKFKDEAEEILDTYSSDVSSSEVEKDDRKEIEFTVSLESEDIDELTEELKGIDDLKSGELSIRVLEQESLIEKGQQTKGSSTSLSQEELYSKAQESAEFSGAQWGLIAVSSAIAAYGLALDNVIVVIGAMMLAPLLSPFVSGAISLVVGDRDLMRQSLLHGSLSILLAVAVSFIAVLPFPVQVNPTLQLVVSSSVLSVLLSLLVGSAAALSFATGLRDQIAGVAVAIALVPPLAAIGIGLKMGDLFFVGRAATIAAINLLSVIIAGYSSFKGLGLSPSTYYREKEADRLKLLVPAAFILLVIFAAPVTYSSYQGYQDLIEQQQVRDAANQHFGDDLLELRFEDSEVTVLVIGEHNVTGFKKDVPEGVDVEVRQLQTG